MVELSINFITRPLLRQVNRSFERMADCIHSKHPDANPQEIDHDLKALAFDAASAMLVSAVVLAYFKTIHLAAAVLMIGALCLFRRVIHEAMPKESNRPNPLKDVIEQTKALTEQSGQPTLTEKIKPYFYHGDEISIGNVILLKLLHHPVPKFLEMIRS
jgi:hypothetical protein